MPELDGTLTGRVVKAQVKTKRLAGFSGGSCGVPVSVSTLNYWACLPVNVVVILVDLHEEKLYWAVPGANGNHLGAASITIRFHADDCIDASQDRFLGLLRELSATPADSTVLEDVTAGLRRYASLFVTVPGDWEFRDEARGAEIRQVYRHVNRLRLFLGLPGLVAFDLWETRSAFLSRVLNLDAGAEVIPRVSDEIWYFLRPYYREALSSLGSAMESSALLRGKYPELRGMADESFFSEDGLEQLFSGIESAGGDALNAQAAVLPCNDIDPARVLALDAILDRAGCRLIDCASALKSAHFRSAPPALRRVSLAR